SGRDADDSDREGYAEQNSPERSSHRSSFRGEHRASLFAPPGAADYAVSADTKTRKTKTRTGRISEKACFRGFVFVRSHCRICIARQPRATYALPLGDCQINEEKRCSRR